MAGMDQTELLERLSAISNQVAKLIADVEASAGSDAETSPDAAAEAPGESPIASEPAEPAAAARRKIAWGAKVSQVFRDRIWWIADQLELDPDDLMSCIAWESGETFSPAVKNMAGSGATGLIQFMPSTAVALGTTTAALAAMSAEDQLNYVYKYFAPSKGRLKTLGDVYMAILWPRGVGKPDSYEIFVGGTTAYRQNAGLDVNKDNRVTRGECLVKVNAKKEKGLLPENMG